jgi:CubicO group peptidase (beta-lactamase class C family)
MVNSLYASRDKHDVADSWSVAKSFTGVLVGIAIEQGYIKSLQESASNYITEWSDDDRAGITIRNLLDMRSGLYDIGNNIVLYDNQMGACINRGLNAALSGATKPWLYSNCDSMVLGEILYRATGKDIQDYAEINLFSKIGMSAQWWRDNSDEQVGGSRLAYCCLDATSRDFAKFGQLILNNGLWDGEQIIPTKYMEAIKGINAQVVQTDSDKQYNKGYGLQFWSFSPVGQPSKTVYQAAGANGQYIMIDFDNQIVIVRNSLYKHFSLSGGDKNMKVPDGFLSDLTKVNLASINFPVSLPGTTLTNIDYNFDNQVFHEKIISSIQ